MYLKWEKNIERSQLKIHVHFTDVVWRCEAMRGDARSYLCRLLFLVLFFFFFFFFLSGERLGEGDLKQERGEVRRLRQTQRTTRTCNSSFIPPLTSGTNLLLLLLFRSDFLFFFFFPLVRSESSSSREGLRADTEQTLESFPVTGLKLSIWLSQSQSSWFDILQLPEVLKGQFTQI